MTGRMIDLTPTWAATANILIMALEAGTPTGKEMARVEIMKMGRILDDLVKKRGAI